MLDADPQRAKASTLSGPQDSSFTACRPAPNKLQFTVETECENYGEQARHYWGYPFLGRYANIMKEQR